jgi:hypothetical protein
MPDSRSARSLAKNTVVLNAARLLMYVQFHIPHLTPLDLSHCQEASKRLSIRKLPPVLSFQFKVITLQLCPPDLTENFVLAIRTQNV